MEIARLRAYPDSLARSMVKHHLQFFPIWRVVPRLARRDAELWMRQILIESSFNILGVLAGLNRQYFTAFQFKRTASFIRSLPIAPPALATRLDSLWSTNFPNAALALRELVSETAELVAEHMPYVDLTIVRRARARNDVAWTNLDNGRVR